MRLPLCQDAALAMHPVLHMTGSRVGRGEIQGLLGHHAYSISLHVAWRGSHVYLSGVLAAACFSGQIKSCGSRKQFHRRKIMTPFAQLFVLWTSYNPYVLFLMRDCKRLMGVLGALLSIGFTTAACCCCCTIIQLAYVAPLCALHAEMLVEVQCIHAIF